MKSIGNNIFLPPKKLANFQIMNIFKIVFIFIIYVFTYISCTSDDSADKKSEFITQEELSYATPNGFIIMPDSTNNRLERIYLSNGTIINDMWDNYNFCHYSNNLTQDVILAINDIKVSELTDGTYNFNLDVYGASDIQYVGFRLGIDILDNCAFSYHKWASDTGELRTGNIKIEVSGNNYKLDYTFENIEYNIQVIGTYNGALKLIQSN